MSNTGEIEPRVRYGEVIFFPNPWQWLYVLGDDTQAGLSHRPVSQVSSCLKGFYNQKKKEKKVIQRELLKGTFGELLWFRVKNIKIIIIKTNDQNVRHAGFTLDKPLVWQNTGVWLWLHMHLYTCKASFIIIIIIIIVTTKSGVKSMQVIHKVPWPKHKKKREQVYDSGIAHRHTPAQVQQSTQKTKRCVTAIFSQARLFFPGFVTIFFFFP